jgi:peptidoglycan/LPS O-acetylase OafA/YrhL
LTDGHKLVVLDGLRGVAALAVLLFHLHSLFEFNIVPQGFLAVDLFFMLSGFVLSFAYQKRLDNGWSANEFFKARVIRLYPLYGLSLLLGLAFLVIQRVHGSVSISSGRFLIFFALGTFLIPCVRPLTGGSGILFPLNIASWSLFFEIVANMGHALFLRRRSTGFILAILIPSGLCLVWAVCIANTADIGSRVGELWYGLARVIFSYTTGIVVFRLWARGISLQRFPPSLIFLALVALLAAPVTGRFLVAYDLSVIIILFPLLLSAAASAVPAPRCVQIYKRLGDISYAAYLLQIPIGHFVGRTLDKPFLRAHGINRPIFAVMYVVVTIAASFAAVYLFDNPVREYLRSLTRPPAHGNRKMTSGYSA